MDETDTLKAIEAIRDLKARYFLHIDTKDWGQWADVFAPDAVMDMSAEFAHAPDPSQYVFRTREGIVAAVSAGLGETVTVHHGHMPVIRIVSAVEAEGVWAMEDNLFMPDGLHMLGYGHYHERYRRIDGRWYIAHTRLTRLRQIMNPFAIPVAAQPAQ